MKVAFLKPPVGGILGLEMLTFVEPLGPICVAACLEAEGHECMVFDFRIDGEDEGMEECRRFSPDVVGLQCNFTTERFRTVKLAERIRREVPGAFIVVGGHDASRIVNYYRNDDSDKRYSSPGSRLRRSCSRSKSSAHRPRLADSPPPEIATNLPRPPATRP